MMAPLANNQPAPEDTPDQTMDFDHIIVGGGTAGAVLANRLSARSAKRVLLCEAGPDIQEGQVPAEILDSFPAYAYLNPRFLWTDLTVTTQVTSHNRAAPSHTKTRKYEQARVMGGGSSINGQLANRGAPHDYDEWEQRGAAGWNWNAVLPYFKKLERDVDFNGPLHGRDGPTPIRRIFPDHWAGHVKAMEAGFRGLGYEYLEDQNGEFRDGYYPVTISNFEDRRVPTALAYLDSATRQRPNLTILADTQINELLFEGTRCVGVRAATPSGEQVFRGREIILSCGAIYSPVQLLRAGIGPAGHLKDLGIAVRAHRQGVGQRLMDHPSVALAAFVKPSARLNGQTRRHLLIGLRFSSDLHGAPHGDMAVSVSTKSAWHAVGEQIAAVTMWVNKTFSEAGEIKLRSGDRREPPSVNFNLLRDRRDLDRLKNGFRRLASMFDLPAVQAAVSDPFASSFSEKVKKIGTVSRKNAIITAILAKLLDGPDALRRLLIRNLIMEGKPLSELLRDDDALEEFIRGAAIGVWHASCSCRMGAADDAWAVTDPEGRVYGAPGLRVVDASIFPVIPSANINIPTIMVAEKIADAILAGS
jgi:5-(hydroxymethyl)furfural/furfural oxidase